MVPSVSADIKKPPLDVHIQVTADHKGPVWDPVQYLGELPSAVVQSIRSPEEYWRALEDEYLRLDVHKYYKLFYNWYLTQLPLVVFSDKQLDMSDNQIVKFILNEDFGDINFLFLEKAITSEQLIALVDKYNYTPPERLNLFLLILHKNISEEELSKLFTVWNIAEHTAVYARDYKKYMGTFIDTLSFSSEEQDKETVLSMLDKHQLPITSVLHELFQTNKATLFNEAVKNPQINVNIQNYLSQTVLHTASNAQWINAEPYIRSLFQRPDLNLNIVDFQGWTPIFYIVHNSQSRDSEGIKLFLSRKSKLNMDIQDYNLRALPLLAAELGMPDLAELLHQQGAPLPEQVSRLNSYMTKDYQGMWFKYKVELNLDEMAELFTFDSIKPSFSEFQKKLQAGEFLMKNERTWEYYKYYFLFQLLHNFFTKEENMRYLYIMNLMFDEKRFSENFRIQLTKVLYQDITRFKEMFSVVKNKKELLNSNLLYTQFLINNEGEKKTILEFKLLDRVNIKPIPQSDNALYFATGVSSFLTEAVRTTQIEVVKFLLQEGADPTFNEKNFIMRNSIVAAILTGDLLYKHEDLYQGHLRIVDMLMSHPSVTKDFLHQDVIPGINYVDLAALRGDLYILKKMYKKGAHVSHGKSFWDTDVSIERLIFSFGFIKLTDFILQKEIDRGAGNEFMEKNLKMCKKAFH